MAWLNGSSARKTFVANRITEITEELPADCWRHVKSEENPADCASRGLSPEKLKGHNMWWMGPAWLKQPKEIWEKPYLPKDFATNLEEKVKKVKVLIAIVAKIEIDLIRDVLTKMSQEEFFAAEIKVLQQSEAELDKKNRLLSLRPFLDKKGILRVGGRLKFSSLVLDEKHPPIISNKSRLAALLIAEAH